MKRGTPSHPKTLELAAALDLPQWGAVGILESLWHFAATYGRRGDVGRHSDGAIAKAIGWQGDPGRLMTALVDTGWLDRCGCHRLRIHDWPEHADQTVSRTEEVRRRGFLSCYVAPEPLRGAAFERRADLDASSQLASDEQKASQPTPTPEPTPTDPPQAPPSGGALPGPRLVAPAAPHVEPGAAPGLEPASVSPGRSARRGRAQALRDGADEAERYWIRLGGHPRADDRRRIRDALREGRPLAQVLGSIGERVRDELLAAGRLGPADPWPPPGLAPFDAPPRPPTAPARASPAEVAEAREAWERVGQALRSWVSPEAWATWIRPCRGLYVRERRIVVETPGPQHLDWIGRTWSAELQWAAAEVGLEGVDLVTAPPVAAGE